MEGENFPYFFTQSSYPAPDSILDQSMQNPDRFPNPSDQHIDLTGLLSGGVGGPVDQNLNSIRAGGENIIINNVVGRNKGKCSKKKKYVPSRVAFHTRSAEDILDDGYKWRKYGQKSVKNNVHPRSYYRCTHHTCTVKKQIQRLSKDTNIVVNTYEGIHNHPCEKLMETLGPLLKQLQFLSRF